MSCAITTRLQTMPVCLSMWLWCPASLFRIGLSSWSCNCTVSVGGVEGAPCYKHNTLPRQNNECFTYWRSENKLSELRNNRYVVSMDKSNGWVFKYNLCFFCCVATSLDCMWNLCGAEGDKNSKKKDAVGEKFRQLEVAVCFIYTRSIGFIHTWVWVLKTLLQCRTETGGWGGVL